MTNTMRDNGYESGSLVKFRKISRIWRDCGHEEKRPQEMKFLGAKSNQKTSRITSLKKREVIREVFWLDLVPRNFNFWGRIFEVRLPGGPISH